MTQSVVRVLGETIHVDFPSDFVECRLDRWHEKSSDVTAEVTVLTTAPGVSPHIQQAKLNLTSPRARSEFARRCAGRFEGPDWEDLIERMCVQALGARRHGEELVQLAAIPSDATARHRLDGWVPEDGVTILYGDGGMGKSTLALALGCAIALELPFLDRATRAGRVLYLDYETSARQQARRLHRLTRGMHWPARPPVLYKHLDAPIGNLGPELRRLCDVEQIDVLILDSLAYAGGGNPEADPTVDVFRTLNSFRRPVVALAHVAKHSDGSRPYGSVFVWNSARSVIEVKKQQEPGEHTLYLGLFHRKTNDDLLQRPLGAKITFSSDATSIVSVNLEDVPDLASVLPAAQRLEALLRTGPKNAQDIATELAMSVNTVRSTLRRLQTRQKVIKLEDGRWGLKVEGIAH
jgi:hypothetical protein